MQAFYDFVKDPNHILCPSIFGIGANSFLRTEPIHIFDSPFTLVIVKNHNLKIRPAGTVQSTGGENIAVVGGGERTGECETAIPVPSTW